MADIVLTWAEFEGATLELAEKIRKSDKEYVAVFGIPRGGLCIAVRLSHLLDLPLMTHEDDLIVLGDACLVVDDVSDNGTTLYEWEQKYGKHDTACIYSSKWTTHVPTYHVSMKTDDKSWIVFPWEVI